MEADRISCPSWVCRMRTSLPAGQMWRFHNISAVTYFKVSLSSAKRVATSRLLVITVILRHGRRRPPHFFSLRLRVRRIRLSNQDRHGQVVVEKSELVCVCGSGATDM